jgi:hypothetical protein
VGGLVSAAAVFALAAAWVAAGRRSRVGAVIEGAEPAGGRVAPPAGG